MLSPSSIVVFLGPTLRRDEALRTLPADYRRPVKRGDLEALLPTCPRFVGIIDGEFFQSLAVSPKEVLRLIERGVIVFGASSMGALRAAELYPFGMIGVGRIFELFRSGQLEGDDEVAMSYASSDERVMSVPLVNVRFALAAAAAAELITEAEKRKLIRLARRLYFPERSYDKILELGATTLSAARLSELRLYLHHRAPDLKRDDAILLLREMRRRAEGLVD